ncbi:MAG: glycosyltransferase [Planctomycetota bacterium]|jgi:glycosyltransferase involved in cell wall biosynthesis
MSPDEAPTALVFGHVIAQPAGGVRRHAEQVWPRVAELWRERGGRLAFLDGPEPLPLDLPADVVRLSDSRLSASRWRRARGERRALPGAIEKLGGIDLLHTAHLPVVRPPRDVRLCWLIHDLRRADAHLSGYFGAALGQRWIEQGLGRAHHVLCVSRKVSLDLHHGWDVPRERLTVARHGGDHLEVLPREAGEGAPILFVGHLEPRKNLVILLEALAIDPDLPRLVLAGRPKAGHRAQLERRARDLGVEARVEFRDAPSDAELSELLSTAGCLVLPSHLEGFGLPVIEAQRAGVPAAVARAGALAEVGGPLAASFDARDPQACARALRVSLARPPGELQRAAKRARAFRWDMAAKRLVEAWEAALSGPAQPIRA